MLKLLAKSIPYKEVCPIFLETVKVRVPIGKLD